jgi:prepilin signal peptidase PulO-like enzyme (type II secretory pathway)
MENLLAIGLIVGFVNVVQMTFPQVKGLWAFLIALVAGLIIGFLHWYGVKGLEDGVLIAFVSSGAYKMVQVVSKKEPTQPNI